MKKYAFILGALILPTLSACSSIDSMRPFDAEQARILIESSFTSKPAQQRIILDLPRNQTWKKVSSTTDRTLPVVRLIPADSNLSQWQESIQTNIQSYLTHHGLSAASYAQDDINFYRGLCHVSSGIVKESKWAVTYQLKLSACKNMPAQIQVVKAFNGSDAVYVVRYVALAGVSATQIKKMSETISSATMQNNPGV